MSNLSLNLVSDYMQKTSLWQKNCGTIFAKFRIMCGTSLPLIPMFSQKREGTTYCRSFLRENYRLSYFYNFSIAKLFCFPSGAFTIWHDTYANSRAFRAWLTIDCYGCRQIAHLAPIARFWQDVRFARIGLDKRRLALGCRARIQARLCVV